MSLLLNGVNGHEGGANNYGCCAAGSVTPAFGPAAATKIFVCASAAPGTSAIGRDDCDIMFILNPRARDANWNKTPVQFRLQRALTGPDYADKWHVVVNITSAGKARYYELTNLGDPLSYTTELNWDVATFIAMFLDFGVGVVAPASVDVWVGTTKFTLLPFDIVGNPDFLAAQSPWCVGGIDGTANISQSADLSIDPRFFRGQLMNVATTYNPPADPQTLVNTLAGGVSPAHPSVRSYFAVGSTANCWPFSTRITPAGKNVLNGTDGNLTLRDGASISSDLSGVPVMATVNLTLVGDSQIAKAAGAWTTDNFGAETTAGLQTNSTNLVTRRIMEIWSGLTQIPVGSTITSVAWAEHVRTVPTSSAQTIEAARVTRTMVEGTGTISVPTTDGVSGVNYDATHAFTTPGGDLGTARDAIGTSPVSGDVDTTITYNPILVVTEAWQLGGDLLEICMKRTNEASGTASNVTFDTKEGTVPPTLSITYTPPAAASGRSNPQGVPLRRLRRPRASVSQSSH